MGMDKERELKNRATSAGLRSGSMKQTLTAGTMLITSHENLDSNHNAYDMKTNNIKHSANILLEDNGPINSMRKEKLDHN